MGDSRRRQNHSCDPCRKGKRGCDAPENRKENGFTSCSNCNRWKKKCTFNWVSSRRADSRGAARSRTNHPSCAPAAAAAPANTIPASGDMTAIPASYNIPLHGGLPSSPQLYPSNPGDMFTFTASSTFAPPASLHGEGTATSWDPAVGGDWQIGAVAQESEDSVSPLESQTVFHLNPNAVIQQLEDGPNASSSDELTAPERNPGGHKSSSVPKFQWRLCIASDNTTNEYARSTMTRNLIRIYHDSMENALSCWLTEHNCPYTDPTTDVLPRIKHRNEWGPSWSNRMCIRVCQLDRASSSIRGRALSAAEDKTAARALHLAIVAFASQWTQHAQKGTGLSVPADIGDDERSIRRNVWNEARHALQHSTGIPSFRVIFANIIFSLTQSPLDDSQDARLGQLLENDGAPVFLETANRQLYTFRHKFARLQREAPPSVRELRRGSMASTLSEVLESPTPSPESQQVDPILASQDHRSTLGLLFWLGIMFDTLSAAIYQRPLVVSDEDSQIASASPSTLDSEKCVNLNYWEIPQSGTRKKNNVWGDFFLRSPVRLQESSVQVQPRWPCSYEEAASVLSEATPVKVLLYRRVTQLQTLIYREASPNRLEEVIQETLLVYQHWTCTYQTFMADCVANHESLPSRIQSWYVILDGHWHLAAMLLADVLETIDRGRLGSDIERSARQATDLIATLRIDNALAVGALARSSLHNQNSTMHRHFHDSLNEVAFLVEPWTVVLINSFGKAAYISLDCLDTTNTPGEQHGALAECFQQNCEFCICALQYLGRKSDMAFLTAQNLTALLDSKLSGMS
ncbi:hypothetical protein BDW59DRAFT_153796 [Aspergillus cavernicola]|uniref:Zn(2)-C6 fungal-type domain-containing protein n=1 Tax=Aspergillus cavernicola TaxID=176166 RepID=A0ABR4HJD1_9EURO